MRLPFILRVHGSSASNDIQSNTHASIMTPQPSTNPFILQTPYRRQERDFLNLVPCISPSLSSSPCSINDEIGSVTDDFFDGPTPGKREIVIYQHQTGRIQGEIALMSAKFRHKMRQPRTLDDDAAVTLVQMKSSRKRPPGIKRDSLSLIKLKRMPQFDDDEPNFGQRIDRDESRDQQPDHQRQLCVLDPRYPRCLAISKDPETLNSLHCFVRESLLELFSHGDGSSSWSEQESEDSTFSGRVGLRCAFCSHIPRSSRSIMSSFTPKTIEDIYRQVCAWQRIHFGTCDHVPKEILDKYNRLKQSDKTRGKKPYWAWSAREIGVHNAVQKPLSIVPLDMYNDNRALL
eukprot:scaffold13679_cov54-Attheya_sp.AAC.3